MMLPGFRSRCVTPCPCAFSSASATAIATFSASSSGSGPRASRAASVSPSQVLHHQEVGLALAPDVVQRADVRMVQRGDGLRLALEPLLHLGIVGEVGREDLDRDRAVQPRVGRLVDLAHAAGAERDPDFIRPELRTCLEGHRRADHRQPSVASQQVFVQACRP